MEPNNIISFFRNYRAAYRMTFSRTSPAAQQVLGDLLEFCHGDRTTMLSCDPYELARNEGRRQVWLRIQRALNLTPEEQFVLAQQRKEILK